MSALPHILTPAALQFTAIGNLLQMLWTWVTYLAIPITTAAFIYYALMLILAGTSEQRATDARQGIKRVLVSWCIMGGYFLLKALTTAFTGGFGVS